MKQWKWIAIAVFLIIMVILLCGCGKQKIVDDDRFILVNRSLSYEVFVDTETGVEYLRVSGGGVTPMIDSYGYPYIYPAFDAREDAINH